MKSDNILSDIEKLVADVARHAASDAISVQDKMDVLKLLQPYYALLRKTKGRSDDDSPEDEPTMGDLQRRLRVVEQEPADGRDLKVATGRSGN